jgi:hypothetical protein
LLTGQDGPCAKCGPPHRKPAESASRNKQSVFTIFLREEYRNGATSGGKPLGYSADHRSRPRKMGLPALSSKSAVHSRLRYNVWVGRRGTPAV